MTTKVEELVAWCRRDTNAGCKVIPAPSTKERNDLADLVAQRTDVELRDVWRALETQQEKMVFLWLVTTVTGFETASHIIRATVVSAYIKREMDEHEAAISEGYQKLNKAENRFRAQRRRRIGWLLRLRKQHRDDQRTIQRQSEQIAALYAERADQAEKIWRLENIEQEHDMLLGVLRRALGADFVENELLKQG